VDFLLWWVKDGPLPSALVTTGNPNDPVPGALGQPGTQTLYGGNAIDYGVLSGVRLEAGGWLDDDRLFGMEGSIFALEHKSVAFGAGSNPAGNPPLYLPVTIPGVGPSSFTIADPVAGYSGGVAVFSKTSLWGAEINGLVDLLRTTRLDFDLIGGFRFVNLDESLGMSGATTDYVNLINYAWQDQFSTHNQFYGGQLGTRLGWHNDRVALDLLGKVALGATHEVVDINGTTTVSGFGPPATYPGGIFAQPSNIGRQSRDQFAVVPEAQAKAGYQIAHGVQFYVAYDFLYISSVARPGNQIDTTVNPSQTLGGTLIGPARPQPLFERSDFWAQGINVGLEFAW